MKLDFHRSFQAQNETSSPKEKGKSKQEPRVMYEVKNPHIKKCHCAIIDHENEVFFS